MELRGRTLTIDSGSPQLETQQRYKGAFSKNPILVPPASMYLILSPSSAKMEMIACITPTSVVASSSGSLQQPLVQLAASRPTGQKTK